MIMLAAAAADDTEKRSHSDSYNETNYKEEAITKFWISNGNKMRC